MVQRRQRCCAPQLSSLFFVLDVVILRSETSSLYIRTYGIAGCEYMIGKMTAMRKGDDGKERVEWGRIIKPC